MDTTYIVLPNYVAREVIKEVVEKDFLQKEVLVYRRILLLYNLTNVTNEEIINNLEKELQNYKITEKLRKDLYLKETSKLKKELSEEKRKYKIHRRLSYIGLLALTTLSLIK